MREKERVEKAKKIQESLECTYEEAYQVVLDDEAVDKMTSVKEIENDLTDEQKKVNKQMRSTTSGKKQTRKPRAPVIDVNKRDIFNAIQQTMTENFAPPSIIAADKEMVVHFGGKDYKIIISVPRVKKEEA